jgi:hypothetical protein
VGLRMRQVESAAKHMTELVMERHADGSQTQPAKPGGIERARSRVMIVRSGHDVGQGANHRADRVSRHQRDDRIAVLGVESLD